MSKHAWFDLSGTIVRHDAARPVPLMPELLASMLDRDWNVRIVTRFTEADARSRLVEAGVDLDVPITSTFDRAADAAAFVEQLPDGESLVIIDNKPVNLKSVRELDDDRIRPLGFVGSRQYGTALAAECAKLGVELALSTPDLIETLHVPVDDWWQGARYTPEELAAMIPGLDHPFSPVAGETLCFDQRRPLDLLKTAGPDWWRFVWCEMGWITCGDCLFKGLIEIAVGIQRADRDTILPGAGTADEYVEAFRDCEPETRRQIVQNARTALSRLREGLFVIGLEAEQCRPHGRSIELDRIDRARQRLQHVAGEVAGGNNAGPNSG
ncbi:MAG: hypothetical protein ACOC8H_01045 [bacterium]